MTLPQPDRSSVPGRDQYLTSLAERLRLPEALAEDVLAEIEAHIADATSDLVQGGMAPTEAAREVLRRLGPPGDLGDRLRRTHQTTRRMFAAVGGGAWQGAKDGFRGYLVGTIIGFAALMVLGSVGALLTWASQGTQATPVVGRWFGSVYVALSLCIAAAFGAAGLVRGISAGSRRRVADIRKPVAIIGTGLIAALIAVVRAEQVWESVILTLAIPVVFAMSALRTTDEADPSALIDRIPWPDSLPPLRRLVFVSFLLMIPGSIVIGFATSGRVEVVEPTLTTQEGWVANGYTVVASRLIESDGLYLLANFPHDGRVRIELPDDASAWGHWPDARIEAWQAVPTADGGPQLMPGATGPYLVVPITYRTQPREITIDVGSKPGIEAYLLFLTALDPATGERVELGWPDSGDVTFVGTVVDWFAAL